MKLEIVGGRLQRFEALGFTIDRTKAPVAGITAADMPWVGGGWQYLYRHVREAFTGAWQRNHVEHNTENILSYPTVYSCVTLIAADIAKVRLKLVRDSGDGIWEDAQNPAFSPVLRKPNHYQNRIKFFEWWIISKLIHGNTYVLKVRDQRQVVRALYILDPCRVRPLVAPDGSVFYELGRDNLTPFEEGAEDTIRVPASEIIHDVMVPLFHPLCGVSPLFAAAVAALHGLNIQHHATRLFANGARPGGVLTAPNAIAQETADRIKAYWEREFTGDNVGKVAVLGDGLKYESMSHNAKDAELLGQLDWDDKRICAVFHVPPYMVGVGDMPTYNNIEALNQQYYSQCLQTLYEQIELLLDEGLGMVKDGTLQEFGTEFELDDLLKMDTKTLIESEKLAQGIKAPNESRRRLGLKPVKGGERPYLQEQNWPLQMLADRELPTRAPTPPANPPQATEPEPDPSKAIDLETTRRALMTRMHETAARYAA